MAERSPRPAPPRSLGGEGKRLWRRLIADLPEGWALEERELRHLEQACRCACDAARLEEEVARSGYVVEGSTGQPRPHPGLDVLVRLRNLEAQLLERIEWQPPRVLTPGEARSAKAARQRWARTREEAAR